MLNLNLEELQQHPTPFYAYDLNLLRRTLQTAKQEANKYNFHIHYALKANANAPILNEMRQLGFGADCVSGNEIKAAIENGFKPKEVVFAGVGKSDAYRADWHPLPHRLPDHGPHGFQESLYPGK